MPAVHIRDVPSETLAALKRRAHRHDRSLQKELRRILIEVAREEAPESLPPLALHFSEATPSGAFGRDEIYRDDVP